MIFVKDCYLIGILFIAGCQSSVTPPRFSMDALVDNVPCVILIERAEYNVHDHRSPIRSIEISRDGRIEKRDGDTFVQGRIHHDDFTRLITKLEQSQVFAVRRTDQFLELDGAHDEIIFSTVGGSYAFAQDRGAQPLAEFVKLVRSFEVFSPQVVTGSQASDFFERVPRSFKN